MKYIIILILLSGCATHPEYTPYNDQTEKDWSDCNWSSNQTYFHNRSSGGQVIGGVLFGPLGAVIGDQMQNGTPTKQPTVQELIDQCMSVRGYVKTEKD